MLSVIMPVYNCEQYIEVCIKSFLDIEGIELEIICVDDGSTDHSAQIIKSLEDERIRYIYQENAGAPSARNKGLNAAVGDVCLFFDSDDVVLGDELCQLLRRYYEENVDIIIGNYSTLEADNSVSLVDNKRFIPKRLNVAQGKDVFYLSCIPPLPGNKLFSRNFLMKNNLKYQDLKIGQDLNFYLRALAFAEKVALISQSVMYYRIVEGSISRQYTLKILGIEQSISEVKNCYTKANKLHEYKKYISVPALIAYRSQMEKIAYLKTCEERIQAKETLVSLAEKEHLHWSKFVLRGLKEKIKIMVICSKLHI